MRPLLTLLVLAGCGPAVVTPSDDPKDYAVDSALTYTAKASDPAWIIPSRALPPEAKAQPSKNNVDLVFFEGRLYLALRTPPTHFASKDA